MLLNSSQTGNTSDTSEHLKKMREDTYKKWDSLGFLEGLKGHVKPSMAEMMCCEASYLLKETEYTGKTDLEVYEKVDLPKVKRKFT